MKTSQKNTKDSLPSADKSEETTPLTVDSMLSSVGVFVIAAFCIAYAYEAAFLARLGIFFNDIPIAPADIYKDALSCILPVFGVSLFLMVRAGRSIHLLRLLDISRTDADISNIRIKNQIFWLISAIFFLIFLTVGEEITLTLSLLCGYFALMMPHIHGETAKNYLGKFRHIILVIIPLLIVIVISFGLSSANERFQAPANTLIEVGEQRTSSVSILNTYESGILYREGTMIIFARWDEIKSIKYKDKNFPSPLCAFIGSQKTRNTLQLCKRPQIRLTH